MMDDQFSVIIREMNNDAEKQSLKNRRFPNFLRGKVVDTNDPLNMGRIRFKCPEMHDESLSDNLCPWAVPAPTTGGPNAGDWANPCIGDTIFICWEKGHPYGPIYMAAADPTKRRQYGLESIHIETPVYLDDKGSVANSDDDVPNPPDDFNPDYLPRDRRPMSRAIKDRYGNIFLSKSVGYFPSTHFKEASGDKRRIVEASEDTSTNPKVNDPDAKYMLMASKYGNMILLSDVGYEWHKEESEEGDKSGEFTGDATKDARFEIDRYKYYERFLTEDESFGRDQRRIEMRTRAGHKFEMRDEGWNKTREAEYADEESVTIGSGEDRRWVKLMSKGGHFIQLMDKGFDSEEDEYYKRHLIDEVGSIHDEDEWEDSRQIRMITRHGFKLVLDDRGSSPTNANNETPHGNGFLVKGRRSKTSSDDDRTTTSSPASSSERGYGFEFNEKDEINALKAYSPNSKLLELNDKYGFVLLCTDLPHDISREYQGTKDNEFSTASGRLNQAADLETYHLILDKENKFVRLKTPTGQGLESRDNEQWTEIRDEGDRGVWLNERDRFAVFRSGSDIAAFMVIDDNENSVLVQNQNGKIQIYSSGPVEVISDDSIDMKADTINLRAKTAINFTASGIGGKIAGGALGVSGDMRCENMYGFIPEAEKPLHIDGQGIAKPSPVAGATPNPTADVRMRSDLSPEDDTDERGKVDDFPTSSVSEDVIKG